MTEYKRLRPCLGTYVEIALELESPADEPRAALGVTRAFEKIARIAKAFSLFDRDSEICRFNRFEAGADFSASPMFYSLLRQAERLRRLSASAFDIFTRGETRPGVRPLAFDNRQRLVVKKTPCEIDLNGIAKGFAVDSAAEDLRGAGFSGVVNAGGDLRFLNADKSARQVSLRLGPADAPFVRRLAITCESVATSSLSVASSRDDSSTRYHLPLRPGLGECSSAVVLSKKCAAADGLAKVALFAGPAQIRRCARAFAADILIFDGRGELTETYENSASV